MENKEKYILGLDLGISSVGYALVKEKSGNNSNELIKMGVRIVNADPDFHGKFEKGQAASKNASRRQKRQIRRGYQRYLLKKNQLINLLEDYRLMPGFALMYERSKLELLEMRAKAATEQVTLEEFGRICLLLLKKRGFLSNRKANNDENQTEYKKKLAELSNELGSQTIGQYLASQVKLNPDFQIKGLVFLRQAYKEEFDRIWKTQQTYYPKLLTGGPEQKDKNSLYFKIATETLFYQRPLKSQKHLVGFCRYENRKRVAHKYSPFYQQFRIWKQINDCVVTFPDGTVRHFENEERGLLFLALNDPNHPIVPKTGMVKPSKIFHYLGIDKKAQLNFSEGLEANKLNLRLNKAFHQIQYTAANANFWDLDWRETENPGPCYLLWHSLYSIENEDEVANAITEQLNERYGIAMPENQAKALADNLAFTSEFGSISVRAIRKMMPFMEEGMSEYHAALAAGYKDKEIEATYDKLPYLIPNSLRNPVVEQILNQMVSVVNDLIDKEGVKPDEIRVEMARELKMNAKKRALTIELNKKGNTEAKAATEEIEKYNKRASARDILRYKLWEDSGKCCLYSGKPIPVADLFNGKTEIEHVIPKSRLFNNTRSNLILAYREENEKKGQQTAAEYMANKGTAAYQKYLNSVTDLYESRKITKAKKDFLLMMGENIPGDFVEHQLRNTQYIARAAMNHLAGLVGENNVKSSSGQITDYLRSRWELVDVIKELNLPMYEQGSPELVEEKQVNKNDGTTQTIKTIKDFNKRSDHRHHAVDALITAFTTSAIVHRLNNLNKVYQVHAENREKAIDIPEPMPNLREEVKAHLNELLVSFKKPKSKAISPQWIKRQPFKTNGSDKIRALVPRGSLHEETIMGKIKRYEKVPLNARFSRFNDLIDASLKLFLEEKLSEAGGNAKLAFSKELLWNNKPLKDVVCWKTQYTKRINVSMLTDKQIEDKIVDEAVRKLVIERYAALDKKIKMFQKSLIENPIVHQGKILKRLTVLDDGNLMAVRKGFAYSKNNHHAIFYKNIKGSIRDEVRTLSEVVARSVVEFKSTGKIPGPFMPTPAVEEEVLMILQINDLVLLDLNEEQSNAVKNGQSIQGLGKHLFRVQKISKGDYFFRHCYQTTLDVKAEFAFRRITNLKAIDTLVKVRLSPAGYLIHGSL